MWLSGRIFHTEGAAIYMPMGEMRVGCSGDNEAAMWLKSCDLDQKQQ